MPKLVERISRTASLARYSQLKDLMHSHIQKENKNLEASILIPNKQHYHIQSFVNVIKFKVFRSQVKTNQYLFSPFSFIWQYVNRMSPEEWGD